MRGARRAHGRSVGSAPAFALALATWWVACEAAADADAAQRAAAFSRDGRFDSAIPAWREAAGDYAAEGRARDRIDALLELANAQQALGRHQDSLATLAEANRVAEAAPSTAQLAAIGGSAASALLALGSTARAHHELERALTLVGGAEAPALRAALLNNRGNVASARGAWTAAARDYAESAALAEGADDPALAALAQANRARVLLRVETPAGEVRRALGRAATLAAELPSAHAAIAVALSAGRSYARLARRSGPAARVDLASAHRLLSRARARAEAASDGRGLSYALGYLGSLYEQQGRGEEALSLTRRALFAAQSANAPEAQYRWHWQIGRLLRAMGDSAGAIAAYRQATAVLGEIRYELAQSYASGEGSFREAVGPVYFELIDLLLATAPAPSEPALHQARLAEARETLETLKAAELRDYFRDECVDQLTAKVQRLDQLAQRVAVIYPIVLPERLELLLTLPTGLRRVTLPVSADALTGEVRRLRFLLEKRTTREYLLPAQRVYDWLVRPLEQEIAGLDIDTLVFVPDGALRTIPMSALHDGERFLIERFAVATTPGLSLTDPRPLDRDNLAAFASGLSEAVQGFPALENVPSELAALHALFRRRGPARR